MTADSYHRIVVKIELLDTQTGETKKSKDRIALWDWTEGNWSCDCNRESTFGRWDTNGGYCKGGKRYLVIAASAGEFDELNSDYPQGLLDKYRDQFRRLE